MHKKFKLTKSLLCSNRIEEVCKTLEEANVDPGNLQEYFSNVNIDEEADSAKDVIK